MRVSWSRSGWVSGASTRDPLGFVDAGAGVVGDLPGPGGIGDASRQAQRQDRHTHEHHGRPGQALQHRPTPHRRPDPGCCRAHCHPTPRRQLTDVHVLSPYALRLIRSAPGTLWVYRDVTPQAWAKAIISGRAGQSIMLAQTGDESRNWASDPGTPR
jgi:hypothetical protein